MTAGDDALAAEVLAHLGGMGRLSSRRIFGGIGLYAGARLFAIVLRGTVYVRADEGMRRALARDGTGPFRPYSSRVVTPYWELPAAVVTDKRRMRAWARRAMAASAASTLVPGRRLGLPKKLVFRPKLRPPRS